MSRFDDQVALPVRDPSDTGEVRRVTLQLAHRGGLDETARGRLAIVATEAVTNILRHAQRGEVFLRALKEGEAEGVEVLALDRGPGIPSVADALRDGYSTAGGPGTGLGAMRRLATRFDLHSAPGRGTAVVAQIWSGVVPPGAPELGVVCLPIPGEPVSGDGWAVVAGERRTLVLVVDGLGHGPLAADAADEAIRVVRARAVLGPERLVEEAHAALRGTRGAALAVAEIRRPEGELSFAGVGNIVARIVSARAVQYLVSQNGTVGHEIRRIRPSTHAFPRGALLVMHSDGIATQWSLDESPGLAARHPALVAGVLYRDHTRGRDDVVAVALRDGGDSP